MSGQGALLRALTALQSLHPRISLHQVIVLLHVAEEEGLAVRDLTARSGLTQSTTSRSIRACGPRGIEWTLPPALGLLQPKLGRVDGRSHEIFLSPAGRRLCAELDALMASHRELPESDQAPLRGTGRC